MTFIFRAFLPFAAGYYLSFLFRVINALIASHLTHDLGIGAAGLGTMTSAFFLAFAASQLVVGRLLDRFGPRRVQACLLLIAATGVTIFAVGRSLWLLTCARALLALGFSASFASGVKAIVSWLPRQRISLANGWMLALGALGAITATGPSNAVMHWLGWRELLGILALLTLAVSLLIYFVVPENQPSARSQTTVSRMPLRQIYSNPDFLRTAPLTALAISIPWAMQSLWAAPWLAQVDGYNHAQIVNVLFVMGCTLCFGGAFFGTLAARLGERGVATETVFGAAVVALLIVEMLILGNASLPAYVLWGALSLFGALPALGFAIMGEVFPKEIIGRIISAFVMLNFFTVFFVQSGMGYIIALWPHSTDGFMPPIAFRVAFVMPYALQIISLAWFLKDWASRRIVSARSIR
jgi:predicted MFS family arabinose efflux permease